jgi:cyclohexadienyl dehydratase
MKIKHVFSIVGVWLFAVAFLLTGCRGAQGGGDSLRAVKTRGVLLVGTTGDYCPMSYLNPRTETYEGFDTALTENLAASLGVGIRYVPTTWPTLMQDTLERKFDLAICGITITEARKEQALMSEGYLENGKTVLCRAEDAEKYTSLAAINRPEVRVMENPGGLNEKFAREHFSDADLIIHPVNEEIPALIASGRADVMITEIMEAAYYAGKDARLAAPLLDRPFTRGQLGVLMPPGNEALLEYVNGFLEQERRNGRLDELSEQYLHLGAQKKRTPRRVPPPVRIPVPVPVMP